MKRNIKLIAIWLIAVTWILVIFVFSNMNPSSSNSKSKATINFALNKAVDVSNGIGITDINLTEEQQKVIVNKLNAPLRKCMHASVYFVLALLVYAIARNLNVPPKKAYILSILFAFCYACTDEYHQTFVRKKW